MKSRLLLLSCCLAFYCAQAASQCPGFPVLATAGEPLLAARCRQIDKAAYPALLQGARPGKETPALFAHGAYYISLGKPAEWYSNVIFEKMDKPALGVRKVCQERRDG